MPVFMCRNLNDENYKKQTPRLEFRGVVKKVVKKLLLSFGKLKPFTGPWAAGFLSFDFSGVSSEMSRFL